MTPGEITVYIRIKGTKEDCLKYIDHPVAPVREEVYLKLEKLNEYTILKECIDKEKHPILKQLLIEINEEVIEDMVKVMWEQF